MSQVATCVISQRSRAALSLPDLPCPLAQQGLDRQQWARPIYRSFSIYWLYCVDPPSVAQDDRRAAGGGPTDRATPTWGGRLPLAFPSSPREPRATGGSSSSVRHRLATLSPCIRARCPSALRSRTDSRSS